MIPQNYNRSKNVAMEHNGLRIADVANLEAQMFNLK